MATGKVKWFSDKKGYGFILKDTGGEIFAHFSHIVMDGYKSLEEGAAVEFSVESTPKGEQAVQIKLLDTAEKDS